MCLAQAPTRYVHFRVKILPACPMHGYTRATLPPTDPELISYQTVLLAIWQASAPSRTTLPAVCDFAAGTPAQRKVGVTVWAAIRRVSAIGDYVPDDVPESYVQVSSSIVSPWTQSISRSCTAPQTVIRLCDRGAERRHAVALDQIACTDQTAWSHHTTFTLQVSTKTNKINCTTFNKYEIYDVQLTRICQNEGFDLKSDRENTSRCTSSFWNYDESS
eukprot:16436284-Heterocapsa_arctica.AAC.1